MYYNLICTPIWTKFYSCKKWVLQCVFTVREVFIRVNGTSTNLEKSVWCQVVAGRPSHMADRPSGAASTDFLH
jgi:hypothetical protein